MYNFHFPSVITFFLFIFSCVLLIKARKISCGFISIKTCGTRPQKYKYLVDFAGCGATVPLLGFGNNLAKGAIEAVKQQGILGAFIGGLKASAGGIAATVFFGYIASLISKPKMKKQ